MRVMITGGTGFVGCRIVKQLLEEEGDVEVVVLTRDPFLASHATLSRVVERSTAPGALEKVKLVRWDPLRVTDELLDALSQTDVVIHLAGTSIFAQRWSDSFKKELQDSRILSSRTLVEAISRCQSRPSVLISASGIG